MGWWPFSSTASSPASTTPDHDDTPGTNRFALTEEQKLRIFGPSSSSPSPSPPASSSTPSPSGQISTSPAQSSSTPEPSDAEVEAFLQSFAPTTPSSSPSDVSSSATSSTSSIPDQISHLPPRRPLNHDRILADGSLNIHPSALYPRTMSCRAAFDQAFYCQSLGGKFNDIYRHGELQNCSEQWNAFWFCMRIRTLPENEKQIRISEFYEARDERRKEERGSSEDVWEIREKAVTRAFWRDPDEVSG